MPVPTDAELAATEQLRQAWIAATRADAVAQSLAAQADQALSAALYYARTKLPQLILQMQTDAAADVDRKQTDLDQRKAEASQAAIDEGMAEKAYRDSINAPRNTQERPYASPTR